MACTICRQNGHYKTTCPKNPSKALGKRKQPPSPSPPSLPQNPPTHTVPRPAPRRLLPRTPDAPTMAIPSSSQQGGGLPPRPSPPPPLLLAPQPPRPLRLRALLPRPPQAEPPPSAIPQAWLHARFHEQMSRKVTKRLYAAFKAAAHTAAKTFLAFYNTRPVDSLNLLLSLPARCLSFPKGKGQVPKTRAALLAFAEGNWPEPPSEASPRERPAPRPPSDHTAQASAVRRACALVREGLLSKAAAALDALPPLAFTDELKLVLQQLHPPAVEAMADDVPREEHLRCGRDEVLGAVKRLPRGSAPGPSGWTFELIETACSGAGEHNMFVKALTLLSNLLFSASLPPVCVDDLTASILVPLAKSSNGVRPIAIGEAFIRIAGKVAMAKVRGLGAEGERQYGVCKQAGLERLLHKLREGMDTKLIASVLSLDFKNAFNSVSRAHIAREVAKVLPRLSRFFHLAYSRPAKLFLRRRGAPPRCPSFTGRRAAGRPSWLTLLRHCHCPSPPYPRGPFPRPRRRRIL